MVAGLPMGRPLAGSSFLLFIEKPVQGYQPAHLFGQDPVIVGSRPMIDGAMGIEAAVGPVTDILAPRRLHIIMVALSRRVPKPAPLATKPLANQFGQRRPGGVWVMPCGRALVGVIFPPPKLLFPSSLSYSPR
jgi:hypothetical protein